MKPFRVFIIVFLPLSIFCFNRTQGAVAGPKRSMGQYLLQRSDKKYRAHSIRCLDCFAPCEELRCEGLPLQKRADHILLLRFFI